MHTIPASKPRCEMLSEIVVPVEFIGGSEDGQQLERQTNHNNVDASARPGDVG
jgi:hypothetical protein